MELRAVQLNDVEIDKTSKIAVCIHAFYPHLFKSMLENMSLNLGFADYYVTCLVEAEEAIRSTLADFKVKAEVFVVENMGMDVLPFITLVSKFRLHRYLAVVKLHSKNANSRNASFIGEMMLERNLGTAETAEAIRDIFMKQPNIGIAGPNDTFKNTNFMIYNNRRLFIEACSLLSIPMNMGGGFFAGTMFWIRGANLKVLYESFDDLYQWFVNNNRHTKTGGDGSPAHAFERVFGLIGSVANSDIALIYKRDILTKNSIMRIASIDQIVSEPIRRVGLSDSIRGLFNAHSNVETIRASPYYDETYYGSQIDGIPNPGMDLSLHYAVYGEQAGKNPSELFNSVCYQLQRPDVLRKSVSQISHYINHGSKEGVVIRPNFKDWMNISIKYGLFDEDFYVRHNNISLIGLSASEHYQFIGQYEGLATSPDYNLTSMPVDRGCSGCLPLPDFLEKRFLSELGIHEEIVRQVENNDFDVLSVIAAEANLKFGATACVMIAEALFALSAREWERAADVLDRFWNIWEAGLLSRRHVRNLTSRMRQTKSVVHLPEKHPMPSTVPKICIYTTLYGDIDELPPIISTGKNISFICFSDRVRSSPDWEYRICDPGFSNPNMNAKMLKVLPYEALSEFDYSLFVDANTLFTGRLDYLLDKLLLADRFAMWAHPERDDVYCEVAAIVECLRHPPGRLVSQVKEYCQQGLPSNSGLYEASFIWRAHNSLEVRALMEQWWDHINRYTQRDQLSLAFLTWEQRLWPTVIPAEFGTVRDNEFFSKLPHLKLPHEVNPNIEVDTSRHRLRKKIWIIYDESLATSGSTRLRGEQFSRIVSNAVAEDVIVQYSSFDDVTDALVIVTKSYLMRKGIAGISRLKAQGNTVFIDPIDALVSDLIGEEADGLIASSILAFKRYRNRWPKKPCYHITHHVDSRLDGHRYVLDHANIGYFGEILNTKTSESLQETVEYVSVDTSSATDEWIPRLSEFNCHYAVRSNRGIDGQKPFLKGFVAAHYRSNIMIQRDAGDALFYLGSDYPYLLPSNPSEACIIEKVQNVRSSFDSAEWRYALDIMENVRERSSVSYITGEIRSMLIQSFGRSWAN